MLAHHPLCSLGPQTASGTQTSTMISECVNESDNPNRPVLFNYLDLFYVVKCFVYHLPGTQLEVHMVVSHPVVLGTKLWSATCLCLPSAANKGVCYHVPAQMTVNKRKH